MALGLAHEQMKRPKEAVAAFQKQIEVSPFHSQAHKDLSRVLDDLDDLEGAQKAIAKHVEIHPLDGPAIGDLGSLLVRLDREAEAVPHLEKATSLVKDDAWLFAYLGTAYLRAGAHEKARAALEEAVRISPAPAISTYAAWNLAEYGGNHARAAELARKTLQHAADIFQKVGVNEINADHFDLVERIAWSWDALGWIHYQAGDLPSAERYLKAAWILSLDSDVIYHLGHAYEKAGKTTDAATAFLASVTLAPKPRSEAQERVKKYFGPGSDLESAAQAAKAASAVESAVRLPTTDPRQVEARFRALLNRDGTVSDASFVSGDESLRSSAATLNKSQFPVRFPDATVPRLPVHIRVRCGAPDGHCYAINEPARTGS